MQTCDASYITFTFAACRVVPADRAIILRDGEQQRHRWFRAIPHFLATESQTAASQMPQHDVEHRWAANAEGWEISVQD